jgi:hypothetical protein
MAQFARKVKNRMVEKAGGIQGQGAGRRGIFLPGFFFQLRNFLVGVLLSSSIQEGRWTFP